MHQRRWAERPFRGLFGGSAIGPDQPGLSATVAGYVGHDDDLRAAQSGGASQGTGVAGNFAGGWGMLDYYRPGERLSLSGNFAADIRRYLPVDRTTRDFTGNFAMDVGNRRTRVIAAQSIEYGSLFRFSALPGLGGGPGDPTAGDYALTDRTRVTSATSATVRHDLDSRSQLFAEGSYLKTLAEGTDYDRETRRIGGGYSRVVTNRFNLVIGYNYYENLYGATAARRTVVNDLNLGANYVWPLSFSRRTTVEFAGGTNRITREVPGTPPTDIMRATGSATLTHLMGRTWTLRGRFVRGLQFDELFPDPFFANSVTVTLDGMLKPRLEFHATGGYADGQLQLNTSPTSRTTTSATARLGYAFARAFELSTEYAYYYYDFGSALDLPIGLAPVLDRQTLRVNVRYWIPLWMTR